MEIIKLTALRPLRGDYGTLANPLDFRARNISEGQHFTTDNLNAESLEANGLAERYRTPYQESKHFFPPENKMLTPGENKTVEEEREARARSIAAEQDLLSFHRKKQHR